MGMIGDINHGLQVVCNVQNLDLLFSLNFIQVKMYEVHNDTQTKYTGKLDDRS